MARYGGTIVGRRTRVQSEVFRVKKVTARPCRTDPLVNPFALSTVNTMDSNDFDGACQKDGMSKEIEHVTVDVTFSPEEEKALVRKIDLMLLPVMWIMYLLSYMDRTK